MLASKILALFSCVLLVTSVCGSMRFITYMSPTSEYGTVATITSNFTHSIVECISTNDYRVVLNSTQFWTTDSVTNRSVFYTIIDFVDPSAADALLNAPSALQLLVAFNAVLVAGTTNTRYVTYLAKWGLFNYYAPGLTTPAPTTVVTTHAPANTTTPAPVPITPAPTRAPPNNTAASVGEVEQDNSVVLGVVFGILGCIALVGGAIFVVKKFVMRKKKVKSSGGGYAKRAAQV